MQGSSPHYYDIPLLGLKGGWRALATNNHYNIMVSQNSQMTDRKRIRNLPEFMITSSDSAQICSWPRFLLVKGTDNARPLSKLSTFAVNKAIVAVLESDPFNIKKLRNGDMLIEVDKETQSSELLKTTKLNLTMDNVIPHNVSSHYSLNTKKGVIRCPDIKDCSDEEILGLKDEGIIKLDRILVYRDGQKKPTGTFILTFQSQTLPKYIRVGLYRVAVSQFIPNPIRCFKCQTFGHTKFNCRKKMKFAINVGKKIIQTLNNARMKRNVLTAKETMPLMIKHVQNGKRKRKFKESR